MGNNRARGAAVDGDNIIRESFIYDIDGSDLRFFIEKDYEKNIAKFTVSANYLKERRIHQPVLHLYYDDDVDEDAWQIPILPEGVRDTDTGEISQVEYDHDQISAAYSVFAPTTPVLLFGSLTYHIPLERANMLIESLPKGLLRQHTVVRRKGKEIVTEISHSLG
jgi:hypothetical protein